MAAIGNIGGPYWSNGPAPGQIYNFPANRANIHETTQQISQAPGSFGTKRDG